jgi:replicative DNA helicase
MDHVADDFNKVRIADLMISINRTDEERAAGRARLFFAASRNQEGEFTIEIEQALDRMKFITRVLGFV